MALAQAQVAELRVQLSIGRRNEEELARKVLACERAAESLVRSTRGADLV